MREPTPTLEEFVYSFTPSGFIPRDLEGLLYFDIKAAMLVLPTMGRTAWIMATTGASFETAAFAATDTIGWYRFMSKLRTTGRIISSPVAMVALSGLAAHHHTMTSPPPTEALRSEPGQASWWRAVAQSIGAGGIGVGTGVRF